MQVVVQPSLFSKNICLVKIYLQDHLLVSAFERNRITRIWFRLQFEAKGGAARITLPWGQGVGCRGVSLCSMKALD